MASLFYGKTGISLDQTEEMCYTLIKICYHHCSIALSVSGGFWNEELYDCGWDSVHRRK